MARPKKSKTTSAEIAALFSDEDTLSWDTVRQTTGIVPLDWALNGGFGYGRAVELFGDYSTGKSYLLQSALVSAQKSGCVAALIEQEGAFDPAWFSRLGGNSEELILVPGIETVEDTFEAIRKIADYSSKTPKQKIIVGWDGIAATATEHLLSKEFESRDMTKARVMSDGCALIKNEMKKANMCLIATNQIRSTIGGYGPSTTTPGGKAYPFICSQRLEMSLAGGQITSQIVDQDKQVVGIKWRTRVVKNKLGPAFRKVELPFYFQEGRKHPLFGTETEIGIDSDESLLSFYSAKDIQFRLPPEKGNPPWTGEPVLVYTNGWYQLNHKIVEGSAKFRAADWLKVLEDYPKLRTLPMEFV